MLLESLEESAQPGLSVEWEREIARRVAAFERGESVTYAATDVFAEAHRLAQ